MDILVECPFTDTLMHMEAEEFVKEFLVNRMHVRYLAVGLISDSGTTGRFPRTFAKNGRNLRIYR